MSRSIWELDFNDGVSPEIAKMVRNINSAMGVTVAAENKIQAELNETAKHIQNNTSLFGTLGKTIGGFFAVQQIMDLGKEIIGVTGEFQKFDAVLTNTLGSKDLAQGAMAQIKQFAAETPFQINELTGSFVKLANMGFVPTMQEMTKLGDLASSVGKPFDQLSEAIIDAKTFEFERLKEFGIRTENTGNALKFTFKGITTEVAKQGDAVEDYVLSLGNMQGVQGAMAAIMETIPGRISNIQDQFSNVLLTIGNASEGIINGALDAAIGALNGIKSVVDWVVANKDPLGEMLSVITHAIGGLAVAWGVYNGVLLYTTTILPLATFLMGAQGGVVGLATLAWWGLNAAIMANPLAWVAGLIGGVVAGLVYAWNKFEGFRKFLFGLWASVKEIFNGIKQSIKGALEGVADILVGIVTLDLSMISRGVGDVFKNSLEAIPIVNMTKNFDNIIDAGKKGWNDGAKSFQNSQAEKTNKEANTNLFGSDNASKYNSALPLASGGTGSGSKGGTGGGGSGGGVRNVNVTIQQLVGKIEIVSNNVMESSGKIKEMVAEALLAAVIDTELSIN